MVEVYRVREEVAEVPAYNMEGGIEGYRKACQEYVEKVVAFAKRLGKGKYAGKIVRFPVADGYARYVVMSLKPVKLLHLQDGDGWDFQYIERLTAKDIKEAI